MLIFLMISYYFFIGINLCIVINDFLYKKIPNKLLLYLIGTLPIFGFLLSFGMGESIDFSFILQMFVSFIITFALYYFGIWGAGDAKYLLVLSLFLPHIGILTFIGNIAILTLGYLMIYFIGFYIKKISYDFLKGGNFFKSILLDLKEKFYYTFIAEHKLNNKSIIQLLGTWLLKFLVIFTSLRLLKIYIFDQYVLNYYYQIIENESLVTNILNNSVLLFFLIGGSIFLFYYATQKIYNYIYNKILNFTHFIILPRLNIDKKYSKDILIIIMLILLIIPIIIEYQRNPLEILNNLYLIASYYLGFYILFKIFYYLYKITFQVGEIQMLHINNLKVGEIIDKGYLIEKFGNENCLGAFNNTKGFMYPSPKNYINNLENPVDKKSINDIKKAYRIVNKMHDNGETSPLNTIKTLKTFAFSGYIFAGFIFSYIFADEIFTTVMNFILNIIKSLYG